ncbi:pyruvate kinase [Paenibacillus mucilaginosus]|uniref:Pyruvate kinase n=3 Tax=Paenibacillus mucilaginosus TaxID=61624 RepID=H6NS96_9BACL|nr:pyruvate kinase [Paenibacillus mucilaginosus]AEI39099.1 Pyk [Paenibacillus mucilaginosus KNP414]AFC27390.1 Pyk [Paenibacillus mucilaginosus 3016]AFH59534.1 pyruvate kinase [Paenibacillus mucilaginosus K02]MCG7216224.1 pyruvate kinase [Paenibacillus mucilaginosus]WDM28123.1 pyruvate kinase [Paenibacillus mucilaginosus]
MRKTKIICTLGPACDNLEVLKEMIRAGMNVARLNMAHGDLDEQRTRIRRVRQAASELGAAVAVLLDIKGPEVRIGKLKDSSYELKTDGKLTLTTEIIEGTAERISVSYAQLPQDLHPGSRILIDDGLIELRVEEVEGTEIHCRIVNGGVIKPRKGVNLPGVKTSLPGVTERDVQHIHFAAEEDLDIIAVSFVRRAADILEVRELLEQLGAGHIQIISKIENEEGVDELDAILEVSDGLMVARGDLGVEIPVEDVPILQKLMIRKCNQAGKPVITATHMLDSMQVNPRPTRAEASDVANAVLDGTDVLMLSGESAAGKYPVESVQTMAAIAERTEATLPYWDNYVKRAAEQTPNVTEVISQAVVGSSLELNAKAILTPTETGFTARMVSKYRPKAPIVAIAPDERIRRRMSLIWGVTPVLGEPVTSTDAMFLSAVDGGKKSGLVEAGDLVIVSAGVPIGGAGSTNLIKIMNAE